MLTCEGDMRAACCGDLTVPLGIRCIIGVPALESMRVRVGLVCLVFFWYRRVDEGDDGY